jgi:hypothetical protein
MPADLDQAGPHRAPERRPPAARCAGARPAIKAGQAAQATGTGSDQHRGDDEAGHVGQQRGGQAHRAVEQTTQRRAGGHPGVDGQGKRRVGRRDLPSRHDAGHGGPPGRGERGSGAGGHRDQREGHCQPRSNQSQQQIDRGLNGVATHHHHALAVPVGKRAQHRAEQPRRGAGHEQQADRKTAVPIEHRDQQGSARRLVAGVGGQAPQPVPAEGGVPAQRRVFHRDQLVAPARHVPGSWRVADLTDNRRNARARSAPPGVSDPA